MVDASPPPKTVELPKNVTSVATVPGHDIHGTYLNPQTYPFHAFWAEVSQAEDGGEEKEYCPVQEYLECKVIWTDEEKGNGSLQIEFNDVARGSAIDWSAFVVALAHNSGRLLSEDEIEIAARMAQITSGDWVPGLDPLGRTLMLQSENHTASFSVQGRMIVFDFDPRWEPIVAPLDSIDSILSAPGVVIVYDPEERALYIEEQIEAAMRKEQWEEDLRTIGLYFGIPWTIIIAYAIRKYRYGKG